MPGSFFNISLVLIASLLLHSKSMKSPLANRQRHSNNALLCYNNKLNAVSKPSNKSGYINSNKS